MSIDDVMDAAVVVEPRYPSTMLIVWRG